MADAHLGSVRTLRLALFATAGSAVALMFTGSALYPVLLVSAILGGASAPAAALDDAIALTHLGAGRQVEYGSVRLWASAGWAVAALLAGAWYQRAGLAPVLPVYVCGVLIWAGYTFRFSTTPATRATRASPLHTVADAFRSCPKLKPFLAGLFLVATATSAAWTFLPLRIVSTGGGPFLVGVAAGLSAAVEIPFMRASPWLVRRVGLRRLYASGAAVYAAMMLVWTLLSTPTIVALVTMVRGAGFGLTYVAMVMITERLVPTRLRNTGQLLLQTISMGIAPVAGAAIGGLVYQRLGASALFVGAAAFTVLGTTVIWTTLSEPAFSERPAGA